MELSLLFPFFLCLFMLGRCFAIWMVECHDATGEEAAALKRTTCVVNAYYVYNFCTEPLAGSLLKG